HPGRHRPNRDVRLPRGARRADDPALPLLDEPRESAAAALKFASSLGIRGPSAWRQSERLAHDRRASSRETLGGAREALPRGDIPFHARLASQNPLPPATPLLDLRLGKLRAFLLAMRPELPLFGWTPDVDAFRLHFGTDAQCRAHVFLCRFRGRLVCPRCHGTAFRLTAHGAHCLTSGCSYTVSLTRGTIFERTRHT